MKTVRAAAILTLVVGGAIAATACSDTDVTPISDAGPTPTNTISPVDAAPSPTDAALPPPRDAAPPPPVLDAGPPAKINVRIAHLVPSAGAAGVQVCVTKSTATFSAADKPVTPKLNFKDVTGYLQLDAGTYKARVIASTAADCSAPVIAGLADFTLPALPPGAYATAAAVGKLDGTGATAFTVQPYLDLLAKPAAGNTHLRFVHAAPGTNIPVFVGAANRPNLTASLFSGVAYKGTDASLASTNGYRPIPASGTKVTLGASAADKGKLVWASDAIVSSGLPALGIRTAFAIDKGDAAAAGDVDVLVCDDEAVANATTKLNASCAVLNPNDTLVHVRVAHLSPDAPSVKVCAIPSSGTFAATDLPVTPSFAFKSVTGYLDLPPGTYKARIVAGTATNCATSLASLPDYTFPALTAGTFATAAAVGRVASAGDTAFTVAAYVDLLATPAAGNAHLRFVHAAPSTNIPVWVGSANATNLTGTLFGNVPFKGTDTGFAATNGYSPLPIGGTKVTLGAAGEAGGALVWSSNAILTSGLAALSISTAFAIDRGTAVGEVDVLVCDDGKAADATSKLNASCAVLPRL
jgi:hypothetical protein